MWRIVHNFLPSYDNLQARQLNVTNRCPLCEAVGETIEHIMKDCFFIKELLYAQRIHLVVQPVASTWKDWNLSCFMTMLVLTLLYPRDNEGLILVVCSFSYMLVRDAFMAEALSCLQAIMFARELGFTRVKFEGDSRTIIHKCQVDSNDFSLISPVITNIIYMARAFTTVSFGFTVAHTLAQEGKTFECPMYWIEEAPPQTMIAAEKDQVVIA
ncbi:hypothetical protein V6N12_003012 [Hibiscus sabdariffa]|uniref:Reverse transcriptase zinc-binding domain-containing protein n=1 Tax=Hibiscus sabdariffa TaxID=183260 RepID=A0ABR2EC61_9ROSI